MKEPTFQELLDANNRECALIHEETMAQRNMLTAFGQLKNRGGGKGVLQRVDRSLRLNTNTSEVHLPLDFRRRYKMTLPLCPLHYSAARVDTSTNLFSMVRLVG